MTVKEWAEKLNGRDMGHEMTAAEDLLADADGVVIVFGAGDDMVEFRGAVSGEDGVCEGGTTKLTVKKTIFYEELNSEDPEFNRAEIEAMPEVKTVWCPKDAAGKVFASWAVETAILHETFDILEEGELFCRGAVFAWKDVYPEGTEESRLSQAIDAIRYLRSVLTDNLNDMEKIDQACKMAGVHECSIMRSEIEKVLDKTKEYA